MSEADSDSGSVESTDEQHAILVATDRTEGKAAGVYVYPDSRVDNDDDLRGLLVDDLLELHSRAANQQAEPVAVMAARSGRTAILYVAADPPNEDLLAAGTKFDTVYATTGQPTSLDRFDRIGPVPAGETGSQTADE